MPQVRHRSLTATTQVVTEEQAAELIASGDYVAVELPNVDKGRVRPIRKRTADPLEPVESD